MQEDYPKLNQEEQLKAENDFLKMKLMLERGGHFGGDENSELPPEIENQFLNNIMAFEKQFEEHKTIKVFDKIGRPSDLTPVNEIPDDAMEEAWKELRHRMNEYGIDLDVCSPNISARELYRFTTEELFEHETDDMNLPGWSTNFIYDEFYPDPVYENTRAATESCVNYILQKEPMQWTHHFQDEGLRLNGHYPLSIDELKAVVNRFKDAYEDLEVTGINAHHCTVDNGQSVVTGEYSVIATNNKDCETLKSDWRVIFSFDEEIGYWYITEVHIGGINF
ncbi:MAG: hypothetical protein ACHQFX_09180, partial [Chitinophagales bacterium]